jgi:precorrin-2 dehydrogenase/sirohydrochlorin ferrochelatase
VSTGGTSPALAKRLRQDVEAVIGPEYGRLAELLAELRPRVQARVLAEKREALWRELIDALLPLLREGQVGTQQKAESILRQAEATAIAAERDATP